MSTLTLGAEAPVIALALAHEQAFQRRVRSMRIWAWFSGWVAGRLRITRLRRDAAYFRDQAVWFQGAAVAIDRLNRDGLMPPGYPVIERLRTMEQNVDKLRLKLLATGSKATERGGLYLAVRDLAAALLENCEAVRELRGAIQAFEADRSAINQAHHRVCERPEQLESELLAVT
jgi:hypothetical protein